MSQELKDALDDQRVNALKQAVAQDDSDAAHLFFDFAKTYSQDNKYLTEAVLLKRSYSLAAHGETKEQIRQEILQLIDNISKHYQTCKMITSLSTPDPILYKYISKYSHPSEKVLTIKKLNKAYRHSSFEINDISLELDMGEIIGVVGENGNGKTTLFNMIVGNLAHDDGEITFPLFQKGKALNWADIKPRIAFIPQELPKWQGNLRDNLHYEAAISGLKGKDNIREVDFIVERLDLRDYLDLSWSRLSGGYKARFSLARALLSKPRLLIMDELLANLDFKAQITILNDIRDFVSSFKYPMSAIISSQHLHEIEKLANRLVFLNQGRITFNGTPEDIQDSQKDQKFEIDCDISLENMISTLKGVPITKVLHNGQCFVVNAPNTLQINQLLQHLINQKIKVKYFRDISSSVKRLFL